MINEIWALDEARLRSFFDAQIDVTPQDAGYQFLHTAITFSPVPPNPQARFQPKRTEITFDGPPSEEQTIYRRFFLCFVSAGG